MMVIIIIDFDVTHQHTKQSKVKYEDVHFSLNIHKNLASIVRSTHSNNKFPMRCYIFDKQI